MQRRVLRMSTLIQQRLICLLARKNRDENLALRVMLAKVVAKPTLPFMKTRLHNNLLLTLNLPHDLNASLPHTL